ncbi:MAG: hypothetical protein IJ637_00470 [Prevotella sp.]|nr:hypothetical protein [Prevotella sp.]
MRKLFTLLTLALCAVGSAWAATESSGNTGTNNTSWVGTSCTLDGKYIAGKGGVQQGNMPDKGVKLRSNQGNLVFEVNAGIKITSFKFWGAGNTATAVDIESATVDGGANQLASTVTLPGKGGSTSGDIALTGIAATDNITLTFASGSTAQIVGTWSIEYEVTEVIVQEINSVSINGAAINAEDLATLKSTKALTIDGSSFNGIGQLAVALSSGATSVTRTIAGSTATYAFTINSTDTYTVTVTGYDKTYAAAQGSVVYFSKDGAEATGINSNAVTANGITFAYPTKEFQTGSAKVTLGSEVYVPLKLSTGEAVTVTFPTGKKATKLIVYGWSANGDGSLPKIQETADADGKKVSSSANIFYSLNTADDVYPSVYEYDLDNWESLYFTAGGSASQPFIVMDFVFAADAETATIGTSGYATYVTKSQVTFPAEINAYIVSATTTTSATLTQVNSVPAGTPVILAGAADTYTLSAAATAEDVSANKLVAAVEAKTLVADEAYVLKDGKFVKAAAGTLPAGKAYLPATSGARELNLVFAGETTAIESVKAAKAEGAVFNLAGQRVAQPTKGLYIVNGKKVAVK